MTAVATVGTLFVKKTEDREPDWVRLLSGVTEPPVSDRGRSTGALLVLKESDRWFALSFGNGYHLLSRSAFERGFGRRVSLNAVDPTQLRAAQARTFNDFALHTSRQISRLSDVAAFELDFQRDLLKSVAGTISDGSLGQRIDGTDSARLTAKLDATELSAKCAALLSISESQGYQRAFPQVDTIREILDPDEIAGLDQRMLDVLAKEQFDRFDLFPPELVSDEIVRYRLHPDRSGLVLVEPDGGLLRHAVRSRYADDLGKALSRYHLVGCDANDEEVERWSFRESLHYEVNEGGVLTVLDGGSWYRVKRSLVDEVEAFVDGIESSEVVLPMAERDETEGSYNERAAKADDLALLDKKLVGIGGGRVEPCDLLSKRGHFIHVKRRKGGSGPLSHLFNQAVVSAESLVDGPDFGKQIRERLESEPPKFGELLADEPDPKGLPVVLALITKSGVAGRPAKELPFFSKVTLRVAVRHLRRMGFDVYVDEIPTRLFD